MRILILQLTRMGDVLQTSPLTRELRRLHPDAHITMMVRSMGRGVAERNPFIDAILVYDEAVMYADLQSGDSERLHKAYQTAERYAGQIRDGAFDLIINCTHSIGSAMLLALSGVKHVVGAHLSEDWQLVLRGPWVNYFFTSVFDRHYNDLNLCDIVRSFGGEAVAPSSLALRVDAADRDVAREVMREAGIDSPSFLVAMQLGASQDNKRWPVSHFAALARALKQRYNATIVLVGVKEEQRFGDEFESMAPGLATRLFGKTSIPQLAAILEQARVLVTNDTGTMHVAAAMKCPVVLVSVGFVHFRETGPYGEGHLAVERRREHVGAALIDPGAQDLYTAISPELVEQVVVYSVGEERESAIDVGSPLWSHADVYRSAFAPDGCLEWYPLLRRPVDERAVLLIAYRSMWLHVLRETYDAAREGESVCAMLACFDCGDVAAIVPVIDAAREAFAGLCALSQRGVVESESLVSALERRAIDEARQLVASLVRLDESIRVYGEVHLATKSLVLIARYERENLEGENPMGLAQTTLGIYRGLGERAGRMMEKLDCIRGMLGAARNRVGAGLRW